MKPKSILLILFMADCAHGAPSDSNRPPYGCHQLFPEVSLGSYTEVVQKTEMTPEIFAQSKLALMGHFAQLSFRTKKGQLSLVEVDNNRWQSLFSQFNLAFNYRMRGFDEEARHPIEEMIGILKSAGYGVTGDFAIRRKLKETVNDPDIYGPFTMAQFMAKKLPSVEAFFLHMSAKMPGLGLSFSGATDAVMAGPREAEMVRAALQFSQTQPGDKVLEIGYGTPAVLLAFASYAARGLILKGVDVAPVPENANDVLAKAGIELLQGAFPDSQEVYQKIKTSGPYRVVLAQDTITRDAKTLQTRSNAAQFAKVLYNLVADGGIVVIMNSFASEPYFTRFQAERAGFNVVRWGSLRPLPPAFRELFFNTLNREAGAQRLFVLRRSKPELRIQFRRSTEIK